MARVAGLDGWLKRRRWEREFNRVAGIAEFRGLCMGGCELDAPSRDASFGVYRLPPSGERLFGPDTLGECERWLMDA